MEKNSVFLITLDEHKGFYGGQNTYSVLSLLDEHGTDYTFLISPQRHYVSMSDIKEEIACQLTIPPAQIELEEV